MSRCHQLAAAQAPAGGGPAAQPPPMTNLLIIPKDTPRLVTDAAASGGATAGLAKFKELREKFYGGQSYDFSETRGGLTRRRGGRICGPTCDMKAAGFALRLDDPDFVRRTRVMPFVHVATAMPLDVVLAGSGLEGQSDLVSTFEAIAAR